MFKKNPTICITTIVLLFTFAMITIASVLRINQMEDSHRYEISTYEDHLTLKDRIIESYQGKVDKYEKKVNDLETKNQSLNNTAADLEDLLEEYYIENRDLSQELEELKANILEDDNVLNYKGEFLATAYCSCAICCDEYASNRPVVNYREIVFTASGSIAEQGVTVAVDPKVIPIGTKIYIEGIGVRIAQDTGGMIKGNRLDIYYNNHDDAWNSAVNDRLRSVYIIQE